jgi:hypothetical protein
LIVVGLFSFLRRVETWLHQHIFKVGWLVTKNFQTTTILYYTFFLPGVLLYEFTYWLAAGVLDVRAERAITWPEKQEIGELRLNFVRLSRRTGKVRTAIISIAPLFAALAAVWFIANNIFDMPAILETMSVGSLQGVVDGILQLTAIPDFWLWAYLLFTISNTMMPDARVVTGWWWAMVGAMAVATLPLLLLGVEQEVIGDAIVSPVAGVLNTLSGIFAVIIVFDLSAVAILGTIEAAIERVTGDSATFRSGKMIVMSRAEAIAFRKQERERQRTREAQRRTTAAPSGPPSVYKLPLPVPGPPGQEPVTQSLTAVIEPEAQDERAEIPARPRRVEPEMITGRASERTEREDEEPEESVEITFPARHPIGRSTDDDNDEEVDIADEEDDEDGIRPNPLARRPEARPGSRPAVPSMFGDDEDEDDDDELTYEDDDDPA